MADLLYEMQKIDGRDVPAFKPQHYGKDGKPKETGENNPLPTKDSSLATKLDQLKSIVEANKVVFPNNQDVTDKAVESRLDKIEGMLEKVIDGDSVNTQLTGSNVEEGIPTKLVDSSNSKDYLKDAPIASGAMLGTEDLMTNGTRVGVGVRFNDSIKFRVTVMYKAFTTGTAISSRESIMEYKEGSLYGVDSFMLKGRKIVINIFNDGDVDTTVRMLNLTEFMSSGGDFK